VEEQLAVCMDLAGRGFLELLQQLRTVILQDSVILRQTHPSHKLWNHPVFATEEYKRFEVELRHAMDSAVNPCQATLRDVAPVIESAILNNSTSLLAQIRTDNHRMQASLDTWGATWTDKLDDINEIMKQMTLTMQQQASHMDQQAGDTFGALFNARARHSLQKVHVSCHITADKQ
jgi:hypothetical protein